jgi:hypothetical protein
VFERRYQQDFVIVAVNRGDDQTMTLQTGIDVAPGSYNGLLTQASEVNRANLFTVTPEGQATMHLGRLSALVVRLQSPQP